MYRTLKILLLLVTLNATAGAWAASSRHLMLISDLHVGAGRDANGQWQHTEDFRWQDDFDRFLDWAAQVTGEQADLVLLGDVFELWQSPTMNCNSDIANVGCKVPDCHDSNMDIGCSENEAVARLEYTLRQHGDFLQSLRRFAERGSNRVHIVPGNHDAALLFPKVARALLAQLPGGHVQVLATGHWLSEDGLVYGDHGHQADLLNAYKGWPEPFAKRGGISYLRKPWGENMVQQFYNQYEQVFPIIDNLNDERTGVQYAIAQAGFGPTVTTVGRFFRFVLFQESLRQALTLLGPDAQPTWNRAWVRQQQAAFFIEALGSAPTLRQDAAQAQREGTLAFKPTALSDAEIDALCAAKEGMALTPCRRESKTLGRTAQSVLFSDEQLRISYLRRVLPRVARNPGELAAVYVYGHTHNAMGPVALALGEMERGLVSVVTVNTGAFQRVASTEQIEAILATTEENRVQSALQLRPEQLPPCYNFVWITPYQDLPAPQLWRWTTKSGVVGGDFVHEPSTCLSRPL